MKRNERTLLWVVVATGTSSVVTQLLTVREFLSQFQGNEIVIALILFNWLVLGGRRPGTRLYIFDNIGDICGGALFSFALVFWENPLTALFLAHPPQSLHPGSGGSQHLSLQGQHDSGCRHTQHQIVAGHGIRRCGVAPFCIAMSTY